MGADRVGATAGGGGGTGAGERTTTAWGPPDTPHPSRAGARGAEKGTVAPGARGGGGGQGTCSVALAAAALWLQYAAAERVVSLGAHERAKGCRSEEALCSVAPSRPQSRAGDTGSSGSLAGGADGDAEGRDVV